jgi:hypothetical protein
LSGKHANYSEQQENQNVAASPVGFPDTFRLQPNKRIEHYRSQRHWTPDSEQGANLILNQFDARKLQCPHEIAAE